MTENGGIRLLYDGQCPICRREVRWLNRRDRRGRLLLEDISDAEFDPARYGLTREEVAKAIHGVLPDGRVVRRVEAIREAYRAVGLGWLVAPLAWPGLRQAADRLYGLFAKNRVSLGRLLGRVDPCDGACSTQSAMRRAPEIDSVDQEGRPLRLSDFRGKKAVVLFFYPKDGTPICTREACHFRDAYEKFQDAGAEVIGVSGDSAESHRAFTGAHHLPFRLLSDADGSLRKAFGVPKTLGVLPGRATYVIDKEGMIRYSFNSQLDAAKHVAEALGALQE